MTQPFDDTERRKFKRFVFSSRDEVYGEFKLPGIQAEPGVFKIADIGAGGLRAVVPKELAKVVSEGHLIFLNEVKGRSRLALVSRVGLKVRWVLSHPALDHAMIGCEFLDLSAENRALINDFVESESAAGSASKP
jgi:c-di-GMP-binding flagellar brake protein YcgR